MTWVRTLPRRAARWLALRLPLPVLLNPFEMFLGGLCVTSGVPFLLAVTPQPGSLESLLPSWLVFVWGVELVAGGALTVVGVARDIRSAERFGMTLLGPAAIVYAIAVAATAGPTGIVAVAVILAFGCACVIRLVVLSTVRGIVLRRVSDETERLL